MINLLGVENYNILKQDVAIYGGRVGTQIQEEEKHVAWPMPRVYDLIGLGGIWVFLKSISQGNSDMSARVENHW